MQNKANNQHTVNIPHSRNNPKNTVRINTHHIAAYVKDHSNRHTYIRGVLDVLNKYVSGKYEN